MQNTCYLCDEFYAHIRVYLFFIFCHLSTILYKLFLLSSLPPFDCDISYLSAPAGGAGRGGGGRVGVQRSPSAIKQMLLDWCKAMTAGYEVCIYTAPPVILNIQLHSIFEDYVVFPTPKAILSLGIAQITKSLLTTN